MDFPRRLAWFLVGLEGLDGIGIAEFAFGLEVGMRLALTDPAWSQRASDLITNDRIDVGCMESATGIADHILANVEIEKV